MTEETAALLGVTTAALIRFDSETRGTVVGRSTDDPREAFPVGARIPLEGDSSIVRVMRTGEVARTDDFRPRLWHDRRNAARARLLLDGRGAAHPSRAGRGGRS